MKPSNKLLHALAVTTLLFSTILAALPSRAYAEATLPLAPATYNNLNLSVTAGASTSTIQAAINNVSNAGGGQVTLAAGTYTITAPIMLKSKVTLRGAGKDATVLKNGGNPSMGGYGVLSSPTSGGLSNVIVRNLTIDGNSVKDPETNPATLNNYGVLIQGPDDSNNKILFDDIKVKNSEMGFHVKGTNNLTVTDSDFTNNGGQYLYWHNVYLRRVSNALLKNNYMNHSPSGNGINISYSDNITIDSNRVYNNYFRGIRAANSSYIDTINNVVYDNRNGDGIIYNHETQGVSNFRIHNNTVSRNGGYGIYISSYASNGTVNSNTNGGSNSHGYIHNTGSNVTVN